SYFNAPSSTSTYTLSLHDALPIWGHVSALEDRSYSQRIDKLRVCRLGPTAATGIRHSARRPVVRGRPRGRCSSRGLRTDNPPDSDRKSTRLNSSHQIISYAVFCLK